MGDSTLFDAELVKALPKDATTARLLQTLVDQEAARTDQALLKSLLTDLVYRYAGLERDLNQANSLLKDRQARLDADLKAAAVIQKNLLSSPLPPGFGVQACWRFIPSERIGGDILLVEPLGDRYVMVVILDVSGHGVPSAMVTFSVCQFLKPSSGTVFLSGHGTHGQCVSPHIVLEALEKEFPYSRFRKTFSIFYGVLDRQTGTFRYSNGGHPFPIHQKRDGHLRPLEDHGPIIGMGLSPEFPESIRQLSTGDRLFFYTDGLSECRDRQGNFYGEERISQRLGEAPNGPLEGIVDLVYRDAAGFTADGIFQDDFSFVGLEYAP